MCTRIQRWQKWRSNISFLNRLILRFSINRLYEIRNDFATRYIVGEGYEIGAQNSPLYCNNASKICYIDYLSKKESALKYHIPEEECVEVDIVADANHLDSIPAGSASFIIANHVLEHSPNPIGALLSWVRVLEINGILFLTLPNYRANEFDFEKIPASLSHFIDDYKKDENNEDISSGHIYEHVQIVDGVDPGNRQLTEQRFKEILTSNLHTHYHVFDKDNSLELIKFIHQRTPVEIVNIFSFTHSIELLFIIKKCNPAFHGSLSVRQERFLNYRIVLAQVVKLLAGKILSYWRVNRRK